MYELVGYEMLDKNIFDDWDIAWIIQESECKTALV